MADILFYRITKTHKGAVFGEMTVGNETFAAVENRTKLYDSVPAGIYTLKRATMPNGTTCLQFIEIPGREGKKRPFLIHAVRKDNWRLLKGCIAPGMSIGGYGERLKLLKSAEAMESILTLLDESRKTFSISIQNNSPGDNWTKLEFISRRKKGLPT